MVNINFLRIADSPQHFHVQVPLCPSSSDGTSSPHAQLGPQAGHPPITSPPVGSMQ